MFDTVGNWDLYKIPSTTILDYRKVFCRLQREPNESIGQWLKRVQTRIVYCELPSIVMEFLLIDRFVYGLSANELKAIKAVKNSWSVNQLLEYFLDESINTEHMVVDDPIRRRENIPTDVVCHSTQ